MSADYSGFVRIWKISDVLGALQTETDRLQRQKKFKNEERELFVSHRSIYSHRGAVTAVRLSASALVTGSRDKSVCHWNFAQKSTFS